MPPNLVACFPPKTPEIRELVGDIRGISIGRRHLFIRAQQPREPNGAAIGIADPRNGLEK